MRRRAFLGLWAAGVSLYAGMGAAMSPARPVIRLSCPDTAQGADLCSALTQSLSEAAPRAVILRVARGDEAVTRAQDLGVAAHITMSDAYGIGARLDWQAGPGGTRHTGNTIQLDVMDTTVTRTILRHLARKLLEKDEKLETRLRAMGSV